MATEITNLISVEVGYRMQDMMVKIRYTLNTVDEISSINQSINATSNMLI
jgi:hypothetical protein